MSIVYQQVYCKLIIQHNHLFNKSFYLQKIDKYKELCNTVFQQHIQLILGRQVQGLGYSNIDNYQSIYNACYSSSMGQMATHDIGNGASTKSISSPGTIMPTIPTKYNNMEGLGVSQPSIMAGIFRGHISSYNFAWVDQHVSSPDWQKFINNNKGTYTYVNTRSPNLGYYGYCSNVRSEYLNTMLSNQYIDTTTSYVRQQIFLDQSVQNGLFPSKFTSKPYKTYVKSQTPMYLKYLASGIDQQDYYSVPNIPSLMGFNTLYSPNFSKGVNQPFISPTVPQCQMANGLILPQKIPILRRTFKIPLISSVIGLLIPQKQFILLPLRALNDLLLQLTIDPFAMFTSGYNDISQFDNIGMGLMQKRAFKVTRLVYNLHTYQFYNSQMDQYLKVSLSTGIAINTKFYQLGNQYQVQNSQSLTNSWPVACNQQALNNILVLFCPLDYQNLSFCRKHFRLSNNIIKMQLRINMQYYPSQPLTGNGGCPIQIDSTGDNSIFLDQIYLSNGYMFSKLMPNPRINAFNFAINQRCYNVYNTHTLYDPAMIDSKSYIWDAGSVNYDTAMGMANIHENRYIGKAAYNFSFQPYSHSKDFLTGIDCRAAKSFDVIFTCNPQNWFPRPQAMYIFTGSSVIIQYGRDGIVNINK